MTPLSKIYNAFLSKVTDDEWGQWLYSEVQEDLKMILKNGMVWFRFPRQSLEIIDYVEGNTNGMIEDCFVSELSEREIQIISSYMKVEWLNRCILTWENIKPLYEEKDFSQANLLDKLYKALEVEKQSARQLESIYYRTKDSKPFNYGCLAGDVNG